VLESGDCAHGLRCRRPVGPLDDFVSGRQGRCWTWSAWKARPTRPIFQPGVPRPITRVILMPF